MTLSSDSSLAISCAILRMLIFPSHHTLRIALAPQGSLSRSENVISDNLLSWILA